MVDARHAEVSNRIDESREHVRKVEVSAPIGAPSGAELHELRDAVEDLKAAVDDIDARRYEVVERAETRDRAVEKVLRGISWQVQQLEIEMTVAHELVKCEKALALQTNLGADRFPSSTTMQRAATSNIFRSPKKS